MLLKKKQDVNTVLYYINYNLCVCVYSVCILCVCGVCIVCMACLMYV